MKGLPAVRQPPHPLHVWHLLVGLGRGGAERLLLEVLPHLREHGLIPSVLALKGPGPMLEDLQNAGIHVETLGGRGRWDPRPVFRLLARLRQARPVFLHAHLSRAILVADWATRWAGVPLMVHYHSLGSSLPVWQRPLEAAAARRAMARVAVSAAVAEDRARLLSLPLNHFKVIPNGIDLAPYAGMAPLDLSDSSRPLTMGFLGRLRIHEKGLDLLLQAMALLAATGDPMERLRLEVAGGPAAAAAELTRQARRMGLQDRVRFLGEVSSAAAVLRRWDFVVLPSRQEGFGLVLVEAMAAARPVLATRTGGVPEVVKPGISGWLVAPGHVRALAEGLRQVVRDRAQLVKMGRQARLAAQRFEARKAAAAWARLARESLAACQDRAT